MTPASMPFPATPFRPSPLASALAPHGAGSLAAAASFIHALPYGRTRDRADYRLVLEELRGTCSTKHALLAALAREQSFPVELRVGIYLMTEANTPGVGAPLAAHGLALVPEAHCYLAVGDRCIDLTHPGTPGTLEVEILEEHAIAPEDIGPRKLSLHRAYVERWAGGVGVSFERAWAAREACIAQLSSK